LKHDQLMPMAFLGALLQPIDPAEDITFKLRHPWRWCVRHPIIATRRALRDRRG
jgi:hypothetical protein